MCQGDPARSTFKIAHPRRVTKHHHHFDAYALSTVPTHSVSCASRENEWITITDRTDIQRALAELVEQAEKSSQGVAGKAPGAIPHLRLTAAKVSDEVGAGHGAVNLKGPGAERAPSWWFLKGNLSSLLLDDRVSK